MKYIIYLPYLILFTLFIGSGTILSNSKSPEELLVGKWKEVTWKIEKSSNGGQKIEPDKGQIYEICQNLIIHKAEIWEFEKNKNLTLFSGSNKLETVKWNVKGRGNILEIKHPDQRLEDYQIQVISDDCLIIHFSFDLQVRGIVKMIFTKVSA